MDLELAGRAAVVTGASVGIGKAIAAELAREGVDVAICARRRDLLEEAARELEVETGRRIVAVPGDVADGKSVENMMESAATSLGRLDILVNNAAVPGGLVTGPLAEAREEDLLEDINTKVVGYFRCSRAAAPHMQREGWGRIVNIGGLSGRSSGIISGMRNAAVVHLTKTLSDQLGPYGITVNLIHPGTTRTERTAPSYQEQAAQEGVTVEENRASRRSEQRHSQNRGRQGNRLPGRLPLLSKGNGHYRRGDSGGWRCWSRRIPVGLCRTKPP